jgi:hypothetical protein
LLSMTISFNLPSIQGFIQIWTLECDT